MTSLIRIMTILIATTSIAQAGGPAVVASDPAPVAAPPAAAHDWSGFYGGLGYGSASGSIDFSDPF